jgi:disulfide bond formation protein DsbB
LSKTRGFWQEYGPYLAFGTALLAMLGSLYYSQIAGFVPCTLCWYQRMLMYPLVLITLVGIIKQDESLPDYVLPLSIIGIGVAAYHYLIQVGVFSHSSVCTVGVPCDQRWVNYFGFVTIPLMSLTAFVIITAVMALCKWASSLSDETAAFDDPSSAGENS